MIRTALHPTRMEGCVFVSVWGRNHIGCTRVVLVEDEDDRLKKKIIKAIKMCVCQIFIPDIYILSSKCFA